MYDKFITKRSDLLENVIKCYFPLNFFKMFKIVKINEIYAKTVFFYLFPIYFCNFNQRNPQTYDKIQIKSRDLKNAASR